MQFSELISRMNNLESDAEVALYFKALHQNSVVWQGFKNLTSNSTEIRSLTAKGQPLNAGTLALVSFDINFDFDSLHEKKFTPEILEQVMLSYEEYLLAESPVDTLDKAGMIALALIAKQKDTGNWGVVFQEVVERKRINNSEKFDTFWLPIMIVTLNIVEDKRDFLKGLMSVSQPDLVISSLVELVLSLPVPDDVKDELVHDRLLGLDEQTQVNALRILNGAGGTEITARVSAKLLEKYRDLDLDVKKTRDYWNDPVASTRLAFQYQAVADIAEFAGESELAMSLNDKALAILAALVKKGKVKKAGIKSGLQGNQELKEIFQSEELFDPDIQSELIYSNLDEEFHLDGLVHPIKTVQQAKKLIQAGNTELAAKEIRTNFANLTDTDLKKMLVEGPDQIQNWKPEKLIQALLDLEAYEEVNRISRILLQENPSSVRGNLAAAISAESLGDYRGSVNHWETLTLMQPESEDHTRNLVKSLAKSGRLDEAFDINQRMVTRQDIANTADLLTHIELALQINKPIEALEAANRLLEIEPENTRGMTLAGLAYKKKGELSLAEKSFRSAITTSAGDIHPWIELAELQWESGTKTDAISTLNEGIAANPGDKLLQTELVKKMMLQGLVSESYPILLTLSGTGEDLDIDLLLIEAMDALGIDGIDDHLSQMVERYPNDERFLANYGKRLIWSGETEKGAELLDRLGEKVHTQKDWELAYIEAVYKPDYQELAYEKKIPKGELRRIGVFLEDYLAGDPDNSHAKLLKAEVKLASGDFAEAYQLFSDLNRDDLGKQELEQARILVGLARSAAGTGGFDIAHATVEDAFSIKPDWCALHAIKATVLHKSGDDAGAVIQVREAITAAPQTPENRMWAIKFFQQIDHYEEASELLAEAVAKYPDHLGLCVLQAQFTASGKDSANDGPDGDHLFGLLQETEDTDALVKSAVIYAELEDGEKTQWCLAKAAQLGSPEAKFNLAGLFRINKNYAESRQVLTEIVTHSGLVNLLDVEIAFSSGEAENLKIDYSENNSDDPEIQFCDVFLPEEWKEILESSRPGISLGLKIGSFDGNYADVINEVRRWIEAEPDNPETCVYGLELALAVSDQPLYEELLSKPIENPAGKFGKQYLLLTREGLFDGDDTTSKNSPTSELFESINAEQPEKISLIKELHLAGKIAQAETTFEMANGVFSRLYEVPFVVKIGILRNLAKSAVVLNRWTEAIKLLDTLSSFAPANDTVNILRIKAAALAIEFQNRALNLGVIAHEFPGAEDYGRKLLEELSGLKLSSSRQEEFKQWRTRLELALSPTKDHIRQLAQFTPDGDNAASMMVGLRATGQIDTALKVSRKFADNPLVLYHVALCQLDRKPQDALAILQQSLTIDPIQPLAMRLLSVLQEKEDLLSDAITSLEQALEYWPNESNWHIEAADLWKRLGNTERPLEHLQIANLYNPQDIQIRRLLGSALLSAGKNTEALSHLVMVVERKPDDYDTWIALSELYQRTGELDLALQAANRAGEVNSKGVKAHLQSARISWLKGEFRKAEEQAKQAQILDPEDPDIYVFLARLSKEQGNKTNALELLEKASNSKAASLNTVIEHANLINEINGAVAARDLIASFSQKYPENPDLLVLLAEAESQCGESRNAEYAAKKALDIKPDENSIHMLLGRILETNGNLDQAAHHYSQAVSLEPKSIDGYLKLSQVYINQREFAQARKVLEQGISKIPGNVNLYLSCAALLKESKDYHGAEQMLRKASQIDPRNVIIHRQLGAILALNMVHQSQEVGSQV